MKVKTVSFSRGATLNVGDFESVKVEVGAEAELEDGESAVQAFDKLRRFVNEQVHQEVVAVRARTRKRRR
jgi:hypothetical protein